MKTEYDILKTEIATFRNVEIMHLVLEFFRRIENQNTLFPRWYLLALIQLSSEYSSNSELLLNPSFEDVKKLGKRVERIQSDYLLKNFTNKGDSLRKLTSVIKHQQFWQFNNIPETDITKQRFLFEHSALSNLFESKFNLSISDFLDISMFASLFIENSEISKFHGELDSNFIDCINHYKGSDLTFAYLQALAISDTKPLKEQFIKSSEVTSGIYKMFDFSFMLNKPILHLNNRYLLYSKESFFHSIKYFIFNALKKEDLFRDLFGKKYFEDYVELGLAEKDIKFIRENELKKKISGKSKVVDYLIEDKIFVDCKAVELVPHSAVNPTDESLKKALKSSIVKGFKQIVACANQLNHKDCIGVIISYKDLRIEGEDAFDEILSNRKSWFSELELEVLNKNSFLILNIDEWDAIVSAVKTNLVEVLEGICRIKSIKRNTIVGYLTELGLTDEPFDFLQEKYKDFKKEEVRHVTPDIENSLRLLSISLFVISKQSKNR